MGIYSDLFNRFDKTAERVFPTSSQEVLQGIYDKYVKPEPKPSRQFLHNMRQMSGMKLGPNATREQKDLAEARGYEVYQQRQAEMRKIKAQGDAEANKAFLNYKITPSTYIAFYNDTIAPLLTKVRNSFSGK